MRMVPVSSDRNLPIIGQFLLKPEKILLYTSNIITTHESQS